MVKIIKNIIVFGNMLVAIVFFRSYFLSDFFPPSETDSRSLRVCVCAFVGLRVYIFFTSTMRMNDICSATLCSSKYACLRHNATDHFCCAVSFPFRLYAYVHVCMYSIKLLLAPTYTQRKPVTEQRRIAGTVCIVVSALNSMSAITKVIPNGFQLI